MELLRSLLFVPGHKDRMLDKAVDAGADALLYDLEDSVPAAERTSARTKVRERLQQSSNMPRYVRINSLTDAGPAEVEADLNAIAIGGLDGVVLPKPQGAQDVRFVSDLLDQLEGQNGPKIEIIPLIESARGVYFCYEILTASARIASVIIGSAEDADLMTDLGCRASPEGTELLYARSKVLLDARAAGVAHPLDGVFMGLDDEAALIRDSENARKLGYRGKTVIHPRQIAPVHRVFTPGENEIAYYRDMLAAFDAGEAQGSGAIAFRGKMIDRAMAKKARDVLQRFGG